MGGYPKSYSGLVAAPVVDLSELQNTVNQFIDQHGIVAGAGPLAGATLLRIFTKSKAASLAVAAGGTWFAVQAISGPMLKVMQEQFGYLQSLIGH
jgi:hypothetical protein